MKNEYTQPTVEIIEISQEDIIVTSGEEWFGTPFAGEEDE